MNFKLEVKCEGGHTQSILVAGVSSREWAEIMCGLMDGTSDLYRSKPSDNPNSSIGKCASCGKQTKAEVTEEIVGSSFNVADKGLV